MEITLKPLPQWFNALFLCICILGMTGLFFRNIPSSVPYQDVVKPFDDAIFTPLGFYHRGWGMFPGPTSQTISVRLRYIYKDGSEELKNYFPLRSSFKKSVWNEVMEDLAIRDDNNDFNGSYQRGFFTYECQNAHNTTNTALRSLRIEQATLNQQELYSNGGYPYRDLQFFIKKEHLCPGS
jgi:hypothetical protein